MLEQYILLAITLILLALFLFVGEKVFGNRTVRLTGGYFLTALVVAIVIVILIIVAGAVAGFLGSLIPGAGAIAQILGFVLSAYAVKSILMKSATYERAVWVTLVAFFFIYIVEGITTTLFDVSIIVYF